MNIDQFFSNPVVFTLGLMSVFGVCGILAGRSCGGRFDVGTRAVAMFFYVTGA